MITQWTAGAVVVDPPQQNVDADCASFQRAVTAALASDPVYPAGPTGDPQHVVYVPPTTSKARYLLANLYLPSNLRVEIDAGCIIQTPPNRYTAGPHPRTPVFVLGDVPATEAVRNVSIVGIGEDWNGRKNRLATDSDTAEPLADYEARGGYSLRSCFTHMADPVIANCVTAAPFLILAWCDGVLLENVFTVQGSDPAAASDGDGDWWPNSTSAAVLVYARKDSPLGDPANYRQPSRVQIRNHVNANSPRGFGPNQLNACFGLDVDGVFSEGGTALRCETDGSLTSGKDQKAGVYQDRGAILDGVTARNVVGVNNNRAVSFSPHGQPNGIVQVEDAWAYSSNQGVVVSRDNLLPGRFSMSSVAELHVQGGQQAQLDGGTMAWSYGQSLAPVGVDTRIPATWGYAVSLAELGGTFTKPDARMAYTNQAAQ